MAADGLDYAALFEALPTPYLVIDTDLQIVALNEARERATGVRREDVVGQPLFEAYPANPGDPDADGVANLEASLRRVLATGRVDVMPMQRYDLRSEDGSFETRWWSPVNAPVLDAEGSVRLLLHWVDDVTEYVRRHEASTADGRAAEADVWVRGHELRKALTAEAATSARLAALVDVAAQIADVGSVAELTELVFDRGLALLGADGGTVGVQEADGGVIRATLTA